MNLKEVCKQINNFNHIVDGLVKRGHQQYEQEGIFAHVVYDLLDAQGNSITKFIINFDEDYDVLSKKLFEFFLMHGLSEIDAQKALDSQQYDTEKDDFIFITKVIYEVEGQMVNADLYASVFYEYLCDYE